MAENREPEDIPADDTEANGESRRKFIKKLTYVAPLMITFQMDEEARAKGDDDDDDDDDDSKKGKKGKKKKVSPTPKTKKKSKKNSDDDDD